MLTLKEARSYLRQHPNINRLEINFNGVPALLIRKEDDSVYHPCILRKISAFQRENSAWIVLQNWPEHYEDVTAEGYVDKMQALSKALVHSNDSQLRKSYERMKSRFDQFKRDLEVYYDENSIYIPSNIDARICCFAHSREFRLDREVVEILILLSRIIDVISLT